MTGNRFALSQRSPICGSSCIAPPTTLSGSEPAQPASAFSVTTLHVAEASPRRWRMPTRAAQMRASHNQQRRYTSGERVEDRVDVVVLFEFVDELQHFGGLRLG